MKRVFTLLTFLCGIAIIGSLFSAPLEANAGGLYHTRTSTAASSCVGGCTGTWQHANLIDSNHGSFWSSNGHTQSNSSEWFAFWINGYQNTNFIELVPRRANGQALGFPESVNVYYSGTNGQWNFIQSFNLPQNPSGERYTLSFSTVNANGFLVTSDHLRLDNGSTYYFQMAEVYAGWQTPFIGVLDSVNISNNTVVGWAVDLNNPQASINVKIKISGRLSTFQSEVYDVATIPTNQYRGDVNSTLNITGNHGFLWTIPVEWRNHSRTISVYAVDSQTGALVQLNQSPQTYTYPHTNGTASITGGEITIQTSDKFAGAINSLLWRRQQFVQSSDHGRLLQTALSVDPAGECYNPTEGGSGPDPDNISESSSYLQSISASGNVLHTSTQMAFWMRPGNTGGQCGTNILGALNKTPISNHILQKTVTIGFQDLPNVIVYNTTITSPNPQGIVQVFPSSPNGYLLSAPTGYMPGDTFNKYYTYNVSNGLLTSQIIPPFNGGVGTVVFSDPVIIADASGKYALGIYSPELPQNGVGYGLTNGTNFTDGTSFSSWNCIMWNNFSTVSTSFQHTCYIAVGALGSVVNDIQELHDRLGN